MSEIRKNRDLTPDIIKGTLIFLMVYGHTMVVGKFEVFQNGLVDLIYTFHMQIFFALSGFYFYNSFSKELKIKSIFRRIFVPYVVFEILYLIGLIAVEYVGISVSNPAPSSLNDFAYHIFIRPIGAYWFIFDLFLIQLSLILGRYICKAARQNNHFSAIFVGGLIIVIFSNFVYFPEKSYIYFYIGMLLGGLDIRFWSFSYLGAVTAAIFAIFLKDDIFSVSLSQVIWCGSIASCVGLASKFLPWIIKDVLVWMGRNTILVLVLHAAFIVISKPVAPFFLSVDQTGVLYTVFSTIFALTGSIFAGVIFDKMHFSSLLFGKPDIYVNFFPANPETEKAKFPPSE